MTTMTVTQRADALGTFRSIEVRLMETIAYWTPITPEMEIKVMWGRHIWDHAQHADWLGKRTFELRQPEQYTRTPVPAYVELLDHMKSAAHASQRLTLFYDVVLPGLIRRYEDYMKNADEILDGPSILVMERILPELRRQVADAQKLRASIGLQTADATEFRERESKISSLVAEGEAA